MRRHVSRNANSDRTPSKVEPESQVQRIMSE
jgi:hypothetical protein